MPTVREIEGAVYGFAPRRLAQSWDNVGLLIGDGGREVRRVLVALDVTEDAAAEVSAALDSALVSAEGEYRYPPIPLLNQSAGGNPAEAGAETDINIKAKTCLGFRMAGTRTGA